MFPGPAFLRLCGFQKALVKTWFVGISGRFVGILGRFVGLLRGSLVFRAVRWNIERFVGIMVGSLDYWVVRWIIG